MTHCGHIGVTNWATHLGHSSPFAWDRVLLEKAIAWHFMIVRMWDIKLHAMLASNALHMVH